MKFQLYFFRDKSKAIEVEKVIQFFDSIPECTHTMDDKEFRVTYKDDSLKNEAAFIITQKLLVPNIYKLNPRYINLNFHVEMEPLSPDFKADKIFEVVGLLAHEFDIYIYNELFEDVLPYRLEVIKTAYSYVKRAYKEKFPEEYKKFHYMDQVKLCGVLNYQKANYDLQLDYKEEGVNAPKYIYLLDTSNNEVCLAIEWKEGSETIFPPFLDLIFYKLESKDKEEYLLIRNKEVMNVIDKCLLDLPGFLKGTKIIDAKENKRIKKLMRKAKFSEIEPHFQKIKLNSLIDV